MMSWHADLPQTGRTQGTVHLHIRYARPRFPWLANQKAGSSYPASRLHRPVVTQSRRDPIGAEEERDALVAAARDDPATRFARMGRFYLGMPIHGLGNCPWD